MGEKKEKLQRSTKNRKDISENEWKSMRTNQNTCVFIYSFFGQNLLLLSFYFSLILLFSIWPFSAFYDCLSVYLFLSIYVLQWKTPRKNTNTKIKLKMFETRIRSSFFFLSFKAAIQRVYFLFFPMELLLCLCMCV